MEYFSVATHPSVTYNYIDTHYVYMKTAGPALIMLSEELLCVSGHMESEWPGSQIGWEQSPQMYTVLLALLMLH